MGLLKERVWNERCKHMRIPTTSFQIPNQTCGQKDTRKPGICMPTANPVCSGHSSRIFIALKTWVGYMGNHTCLVPPGWYFTPQLHIHHTTLQGHKEHNQWRELISEQTSLEGIQPSRPNQPVICRGAQVKCAPGSRALVKCLKLNGTNLTQEAFKDP